MRTFRLTFLGLMMLLALGLGRAAVAQPPVLGALTTNWSNTTVPGTPAANNWTTPANWSGGVPDVNSQDFAVIDNGGIAYVNTNVAQQPGGISLGTNANQSGTLDILSGGSLTVVDMNFGAEDGSVRIGQGGTGNLFVRPGGSLNSLALTLGVGAVGSTLTLGGTTAGAATVSTGVATLGRTTRVIGPNVNFNSSAITLQGTSVLIPELTSASHSPLKSTGVVNLGGALQVDVNGAPATTGSSWTLFDAPAINGNFASITGDAAAPLAFGQTYRFQVVDGGSGKQGKLSIASQLVLNVDRTSGAVSIQNPTTPGGSSVAIDGYTVQSTAGTLSLGGWQSFETHPGVAGAGWSEANPSANRVSEVRSSSTSSLAMGSSWGLGGLYQPPTPTQFGVNTEDLVFQYTDPDTQGSINGIVRYTGGTNINNLVLFADPATGNVKLRNTSPFTVTIDGYTISSTGGSLNSNPALWTSLQDSLGNNWAESNLSDNRVSELQSGDTTTLTLNGGTTFDLGGLFKTAGAKDLVFQFLLADQETPSTGRVVYEAAPAVVGVLGDYNNNGVVDAADYTLWRNNFGQPAGSLMNRNPLNGGTINSQDYTFWKSRFGATSGSGSLATSAAVPEPTSLGIALLAGLLGWAFSRRSS